MDPCCHTLIESRSYFDIFVFGYLIMIDSSIELKHINN